MGMPNAVATVMVTSLLASLGCTETPGRFIAPTAPSFIVAAIPFSAEVKGPMPKPFGCPGGALGCGTAVVEGFGRATYLFTLTSLQSTSQSCADYTATVTFTVEDGSSLTLNESGTWCGPGKTSPEILPGGSYGNPLSASGSWQVQSGTGCFAGVTGSGTDTLRSAGAHLQATYTGVIAP